MKEVGGDPGCQDDVAGRNEGRAPRDGDDPLVYGQSAALDLTGLCFPMVDIVVDGSQKVRRIHSALHRP